MSPAAEHNWNCGAKCALEDASVAEPVSLSLLDLRHKLVQAMTCQNLAEVAVPPVSSNTAATSRVYHTLAGVNGRLVAVGGCHPDVTDGNLLHVDVAVHVHLCDVTLSFSWVAVLLRLGSALGVTAPVADLTTVFARRGLFPICDPLRCIARVLGFRFGLRLAGALASLALRWRYTSSKCLLGVAHRLQGL